MNTNYELKPFINSIGQTIMPGDKILVVTEGYSHRINTYQGIYLGSRGEGRNLQTVCQVSHQTTGYLLADGTPCGRDHPEKDRYGSYTVVRQSTYWRNRLFKLA